MSAVLDSEGIAALDSQDVLGAVEAFHRQCREGWELGLAARGLPDPEGVDAVAVLGMGGSGISGDVVACVVEPRLSLPYRVIKSYGPLPEWIGRNSLVFAVSYSGNTEETLAALEEAHGRGSRIVAISSGGQLAERAAEYGVAHIRIPAGRQPRASLGYLTLPILAALELMGLIPRLEDDMDEAEALLRELGARCDRSVPQERNPAKSLAAQVLGKIPIVYGGQGLGAVVAQRFKCDLNEYGKVPAFWNVFPELNHNEIVGWADTAGARDRVLVLVRDKDDHPRVSLRVDITRDLIRKSFADVVEIESEGQSALARVLSLVLVTQLASIYVALARQVDPGPVEVIESLKQELARR